MWSKSVFSQRARRFVVAGWLAGPIFWWTLSHNRTQSDHQPRAIIAIRDQALCLANWSAPRVLVVGTA